MGNQNSQQENQSSKLENLSQEEIKNQRIKKLEESVANQSQIEKKTQTKIIENSNSNEQTKEKQEIFEENKEKQIIFNNLETKLQETPIKLTENDEKQNFILEIFKINLVFPNSNQKENYHNVNLESNFIINEKSIDELIEKILSSQISEYFDCHSKKLDFLFDSYNNLLKSNISIDLKNILQTKIFSNIISLTLTPIIFNIEGPDFQENYTDILSLTCKLKTKLYEKLFDFDPTDFFNFLCSEFDENDSFELIESIFKRVLFDCNKCNTIEILKPMINSLNFFNTILDNKIISKFFCEKSKTFFDRETNISGLDLQKKTIICSALSFSSFPDENKVWETYFKNVTTQGRQAEKNIEILREKLNEVTEIIFVIIDRLLKSNIENRKKVIDLFYFIIEKNKDKTKMFNFSESCKSSFLINIFKVMLKLCIPFIGDISKIMSKIDKVDIYYFDCPEKNQFFQGIEPFNSEKSKEIIKKDNQINFITEIFFLTTYLLHLNQPTYKNYLNFLVKLSNESKTNPTSPNFATLIGYKCAYDIMLLDPFLLENMIKTFAFVSILSLKEIEVIYNGEEFQNYTKKTEINEKFAKLPLFLAEDMYEILLIFKQALPETIKKHEEYIKITANFMLIVMGNKSLITNPHIRAKFLIFLSLLTRKNNEKFSAEQDHRNFFISNHIFEEHMIESLIEIFIDVEKTGSNNQFYEKFSYRFYFCQMMAYLLHIKWNDENKEDYCTKLKKFSKSNEDKMLQFYNLFLNDVIYLLDESLNKLKEIKNYQENENNLSNLSFQERLEKKSNFEQNKKLVKTFLDFLNSYYENISFMSSFVSEILLSEALREKIVFNLNYTIEAFNGKNFLEIKIKNKEQLGFDPKFMLKCIIEVYLNLSKFDIFLETVVKDERSFNEETFEKTKQILIKHNLINGEDIEVFEIVLKKLHVMLENQNKTEELLKNLTNLPEKFLDPIMNEIMKDPVLLPTSGMIVDRMTIIKHLLSDSTDPFNRQPLNKDMLVSQTELKKEIELFIKENITKDKN